MKKKNAKNAKTQKNVNFRGEKIQKYRGVKVFDQTLRVWTLLEHLFHFCLRLASPQASIQMDIGATSGQANCDSPDNGAGGDVQQVSHASSQGSNISQPSNISQGSNISQPSNISQGSNISQRSNISQGSNVNQVPTIKVVIKF